MERIITLEEIIQTCISHIYMMMMMIAFNSHARKGGKEMEEVKREYRGI